MTDLEPTSRSPGATCFICLDGKSFRKAIYPCCSQCNAVTHHRCWVKWRRKQRLATLRARLLATNTVDPLSCTICKSGIAQIPGEETSLVWAVNGQDDIHQRLQDRLLVIVGRMLQTARGDNDEPVSIPPHLLQKIGLLVAVAISLSLTVDLLLWMFYPVRYWGAIIIPTIGTLYVPATLGCVGIAMYQRKIALGPLRRRPPPNYDIPPDDLTESNSNMPIQLINSQLESTRTQMDLYLELWEEEGDRRVALFYNGDLLENSTAVRHMRIIWKFTYFALAIGVRRNREAAMLGPLVIDKQAHQTKCYPPMVSFEFGIIENSEYTTKSGNLYSVTFAHLPPNLIANLFSFEILDNSLLHVFLYSDLAKNEEWHGWFFDLQPNSITDRIRAKAVKYEIVIRQLASQTFR